MSTDAIELNDLRFSFVSGEPVLAIDHWRIAAGSSVFLCGPSGSGKSTLLHLLCGLLIPTSGNVSVCGSSLDSLTGRALDRFRAQTIGVVFQQFNLLPYLSVLDNLRLTRHFGSSKDSLEPQYLLERLHLPTALLDRRAGSLSVGQQQRVAIARALINRPALVIADEPTSALDADTRDAFINLLLEVAGEGRATVLFVSHDAVLRRHFDHSEDLPSLNTVPLRNDADAT